MALESFTPTPWIVPLVGGMRRGDLWASLYRRRREVTRNPPTEDEVALYRRAVELVAEVEANPYVQWDESGISAVEPSDHVEYEYIETEEEYRERVAPGGTFTFPVVKRRDE